MVLVATGMATELGKVARLLDQEDRTTPLQRRLAAFGKRLAIAVIGGLAGGAIYTSDGHLAVSVVQEGLVRVGQS